MSRYIITYPSILIVLLEYNNLSILLAAANTWGGSLPLSLCYYRFYWYYYKPVVIANLVHFAWICSNFCSSIFQGIWKLYLWHKAHLFFIGQVNKIQVYFIIVTGFAKTSIVDIIAFPNEQNCMCELCMTVFPNPVTILVNYLQTSKCTWPTYANLNCNVS